jgi:hypothetical protein
MKTLILLVFGLAFSIPGWAKYEYLTIGQRIPLAEGPANSRRLSEVNELVEAFNSRFSLTGKQREKAMDAFIKTQEEQIRIWKKDGALTPLLQIRNDLKPNVIIRFSSLADESGKFLAFILEKNDYSNDDDRALFHILHAKLLSQPISFAGAFDIPATLVRLSAIHGDSAQVELVYALDIKGKKYDRMNLNLVRTEKGWVLADPKNGKPIQNVWIDSWVGIFPPNGGVRTLYLDSRDGCRALNNCQ